MNISDLYPSGAEMPLDRLCENGGFTAIFRSIACVGDSLSSGEFQLRNADGTNSYYDMYEYSWGQFLGRMTGSKVWNFSRGGMSAREYMEGWGEANDVFAHEKAAQCYIVALGCNDIIQVARGEIEFGSIADVHEDPAENAPTFAGYFGKILSAYHRISPYAKFFLVTMPVVGLEGEIRQWCEAQQKLMYELAAFFPNTYVIDLRKYGPAYDDEFFKVFWLYGHMTPTGYYLTAKLIGSYIDWIIRQNPVDFKGVGLICSPVQERIGEIKE